MLPLISNQAVVGVHLFVSIRNANQANRLLSDEEQQTMKLNIALCSFTETGCFLNHFIIVCCYFMDVCLIIEYTV